MPLSAIIFGGRRARVAPLVFQARDWDHGVFVGATMGSETTAAATGQVGVVRRDPMAMLPFCGYNMARLLRALAATCGGKLTPPPAVFHVNWFRTGPDGRFLWPGFGQNLRVLLWMIDRVKGKGAAEETPIGLVPGEGGIDFDGLDLTKAEQEALLRVEKRRVGGRGPGDPRVLRALRRPSSRAAGALAGHPGPAARDDDGLTASSGRSC